VPPQSYKWNRLWRRKHSNNVKVSPVTKAAVRAGPDKSITRTVRNTHLPVAGVRDAYFIVASRNERDILTSPGNIFPLLVIILIQTDP
jgi:hypothetical protein